MKQLFRKIVVCKRVKFDETAHFLPHRIKMYDFEIFSNGWGQRGDGIFLKKIDY